jgi:hypothetical protein
VTRLADPTTVAGATGGLVRSKRDGLVRRRRVRGPLFGATTEQPGPTRSTTTAAAGADAAGHPAQLRRRRLRRRCRTGPMPPTVTRVAPCPDRIEVRASRSGAQRPDRRPRRLVVVLRVAGVERRRRRRGCRPAIPKDPTGELSWHDAPPERSSRRAGPVPEVGVGTTGSVRVRRPRSPTAPSRRGANPLASRSAPTRRGCRDDPNRSVAAARRSVRRAPEGPPRPPTAATCRCGRSGLVLAAVFLALSMWRPAGRGVRHRGARPRRRRVLRKVTDKGYRPAVAAGCRCLRCCAAGGVLGRRQCASDRDRVRVLRRRDRVHRRRLDRVRPDAEHGDHDARRRVDRRARSVRRR